MEKFIQGLRLSELFYEELVGPLWEEHFSQISHSAALIGPGSEVLGCDTSQSSDHHWGARVMIFLTEEDSLRSRQKIHNFFREHLPYSFRGFSTNFGAPDAIGVRLLQHIESGPVNHRVELLTCEDFFSTHLGLDPLREISMRDWLTLPEQILLSVTVGAVFHDGLSKLQKIRQRLSYYPDDIWRYLLASQWNRISQEEAFVGRCGDVGDELGSRLIAARLVKDLMKLCFLMEKRYAPYNKWFGTAFARLKCARLLSPLFGEILQAQTWKERERYLSSVYKIVAKLHNALEITETLDTNVSSYYGRPYQVIHADRFAGAIKMSIQNKELREKAPLIGSVDQWIDCTDILSRSKSFRQFSEVLLEEDS